ncbi:MAG: HlyC/CorC family transporter [Acidobacteria bacterium]|nr:HlyC/CorC family transporter [Acidobacteriota bacterium]
MLLVSLIVVLLVSINSFYVTAEFGAVSVRRSKVRQLADGGNRLASRLLPVVENPARLDHYIAACQIGITWSSLVLGAYSQAFVAPNFAAMMEAGLGSSRVTAESVASMGTLVLMTTFQVVFGELIPKSLALQYSTKAAFSTLYPMEASLVLYSWFLRILNGSGLVVLRLLGFSHVGHRHIHSPEEIELLIADSRKEGLLQPEEHERLHRALRLVSRPVRRLMVPRNLVVSIPLEAAPEELADMVRTSRYTRLAVREGAPDNIIGILHTKDVVTFIAEHGRLPTVRDVMRPLVTVPETLKGDRLLAVFREKKTHQAVVIDEHGAVVGLVTLGDLINELLGEISAEFRSGQPRPERLADGRIRLPGLIRVDEVERWIGVALESQAETLAGHILYVLGRIPKAGERVTIAGAEIEIERVVSNTIGSVLVTPVTVPEEFADG